MPLMTPLLQARDPLIKAVRQAGQAILKQLPFPEPAKLELMKIDKRHMGAVFSDDSVHMLMVILTLFDDNDSEKLVRMVHEVALNMLWGYLQNNSNKPEDDRNIVLKTVKDLPYISRMKKKVVAEIGIQPCAMCHVPCAVCTADFCFCCAGIQYG